MQHGESMFSQPCAISSLEVVARVHSHIHSQIKPRSARNDTALLQPKGILQPTLLNLVLQQTFAPNAILKLSGGIGLWDIGLQISPK